MNANSDPFTKSAPALAGVTSRLSKSKRFKIDSGIPFDEKIERKPYKNFIYPLDEMEVGESILVDFNEEPEAAIFNDENADDAERKAALSSVARRIRSRINQHPWSKRRSKRARERSGAVGEREFKTRTRFDIPGMRIWRVK